MASEVICALPPCRNLAYRHTLLTVRRRDGVLIAVGTTGMLTGTGIKGSTMTVELLLPLPNISQAKQSPSAQTSTFCPSTTYSCTHPFTLLRSDQHHVYFLLPVPAHGLPSCQCARQTTATTSKAQSQFLRLQQLLGVATRTTGECLYFWRRTLLQCI